MAEIENIHHKIRQQLNCVSLKIFNESSKHANHYEAVSSEPSHLKIEIISDDFAGLSKIARHKIVNKLLEKEFQRDLHALSIKTQTVQEAS
jgi:BolA protein